VQVTSSPISLSDLESQCLHRTSPNCLA
jgi:hypothetical protein